MEHPTNCSPNLLFSRTLHIQECGSYICLFPFNGRLTHAMAFTVIILLLINPISLQCGPRLGVAGNYFYCYSLSLELKKRACIIFFSQI